MQLGQGIRAFGKLATHMGSPLKVVMCLLVGLVGCVFIWVATPYNNFLLKNSFISDTYFPIAAVVYLLLLVLLLNPLLHLIHKSWTLNAKHLALIIAMLLAAAVVPSQGLLRMLPWSLAAANQQINQSSDLSDAITASGIPTQLFPDGIGYDKQTPVSDQFLDELEPGASIPWDAWLSMLMVWGGFLFACWLLMVGVGLVLFPEWKHRERLQFPLLEVYRNLLPKPEQVLPAVFRDRVFWMGAGSVLFLYLLAGLHHHSGGNFPSIPLGYRLGHVFTEEPWRYLDHYVKNVSKVFFVLVGMAYFMPNRISFSIWFTTIAFAAYALFCRAYAPPYQGAMVHDFRNGAMIMVTLMVLYLSREHWVQVGRLMFSRTSSDADRLLQMSGWMVTAGAIGMWAWMVWAGVPVLWAVAFVIIGFMVSVLIARIVAETGLPFIRVTGLEPAYFMAMLPAAWLSGAAIFMSGIISIIFPMGSRVSAAVMASHAIGIDKDATPKYQLRIGYLMIGLLVLGVVVAGIAHLYMGYTQPVALDGSQSMLNGWGSDQLRGTQRSLLALSDGYWPGASGRFTNLTIGMVLAGALYIMCMRSPTWPLHPIGLLLVGHYYSHTAWASIFIGWLLKTTIVYYGGAHLYRRALPFFLGIIMGEVFSAVIWTAVPATLLLTGSDPSDVGQIPILPR